MSVYSKVENTLDAIQKYKNWPEVLIAGAKKQEPERLILKNGLQLVAPIGLKAMVNEIFFSKDYTPAPISIEIDDIVVDIGANTGVFTVYAASLTRNAVYAFEPFPGAFEVLRCNIAANGLSHATAFCAAMSDSVGSARLFLNPDDCRQNLLSEFILKDKIEKYQPLEDLTYLERNSEMPDSYFEVPTTTLQVFMDSHLIEYIDFLKLDCEGAEFSILQSTPRTCLQRIRKIAMEFHDHLTPLDHSELQRLLEDVGFRTQLKWEAGSPLGFLYGWRK